MSPEPDLTPPPAPPGFPSPADFGSALRPPPAPPDPAAAPAAARPATWADIIGGYAKKYKIDPRLALSIARTESGLDPAAVSPAGAKGIMQLMPETAARHKVNMDDPVDIVRGGMEEFRQLLDDNSGNVVTALRRYNASPQAPREATDPYVQKVIDGLQPTPTPTSATAAAPAAAAVAPASKVPALAPPPAPPSPASFEGQPSGPAALGWRDRLAAISSHIPSESAYGPMKVAPALQTQLAAAGVDSPSTLQHIYDAATQPYDPRTREGRHNLAGTGATIAAAALAPEALGSRSALWAMTKAALTAGGGGVLEEAGEQAVEGLRGQRTEPDPGAVVGAGEEQAKQDVIGHMIMAVPRFVGRVAAGKGIASEVATAMGGERNALRDLYNNAIDTLSQAGRDVKLRFGQDKAARTVASEAAVKEAQQRAEDALAHGQETTSATLRGARAQQLQTVDEAKAQAEAALGQAREGYQQDIGPMPDETHIGTQAARVLEKPAKADLKVLGENLGKAVESGDAGPKRDLVPIQDEARRLVEEELLPPERALPRDRSKKKDRTLWDRLGIKATKEEMNALSQSPVMAVIDRIVNAKKKVRFSELHGFLQQLASQTDFDSPVADKMNGIRKKLYSMIREELGTHQPYDTAATIYDAARDTLTEGYAGNAAKVADLEPGRIIQQIRPDDPLQTSKLMTLLRVHAPQVADRVSDAWLYRNVLQGGVEGLGQRLKVLVDRPQFASAMFGDRLPPTLKQYSDVATAWDALKASGDAAVTRTERTASEDLLAAKERAAQRMQRIGQAGKTVVEDTRQAGVDTARASRAVYDQARKEAADEMAANRIGKRNTRTISDQEALALRHASREAQQLVDEFSAVVYPKTFRGAIGLIRSLTGPRSGEILKIAAGRPEVNQALVAWLANPNTRVAYQLVKRMIGQEVEEHGKPLAAPLLQRFSAPPPPPPSSRSQDAPAPATPR